LKGIIGKIGYDYDIDMVVRGEPKMSPSHVMQVIKSISARAVFPYIPRDQEAIFLGQEIMNTKLFRRNDRECR